MSTTNCPKHGYFDNRETRIDECPACLRARVAELETEVEALKPYRYLHPGVPAERDRYRAAFLHVCESEGMNADAILARF